MHMSIKGEGDGGRKEGSKERERKEKGRRKRVDAIERRREGAREEMQEIQNVAHARDTNEQRDTQQATAV